MGVSGGDHVGTRRVHRRVNSESCDVHRAVTLYDLTSGVHAYEVRGADVTEVLGKRVDPERVRVLGIPGRYVARDPFVEAALREQAERRGQSLLAVEPLFND
jgi:hypothetical protein